MQPDGEPRSRARSSAARPPKGWTASFIELTFPGKVKPFKFTTGVVVLPVTLPFAK